jgi:hypothetical protein
MAAMEQLANTERRYSWKCILIGTLLWAALIWMHRNERLLHQTIPMWLHTIVWSSLLGGALGGLSGRIRPIIWGLILGAILGPIIVFGLFSIAFIRG